MNLLAPRLLVDAVAHLGADWFPTSDVSMGPPAAAVSCEFTIRWMQEFATHFATLSKRWVLRMLDPTAANHIADAFCLGCIGASCHSTAELVALPCASPLRWGLPGIHPPAASIKARNLTKVLLAHLWLTCSTSAERSDE
jgi:hypothetical protein